jgi:hypothetical protein
MFAETLRHDSASDNYNSNFRQLLHVGYKIAAEMGERYIRTLNTNEEVIADNVMRNILDRHIKPIFMDS